MITYLSQDFMMAIDRRPDLTDGLKMLKCRTLVFVGESSPFHCEALHMIAKLDKRCSALVEVITEHVFLHTQAYAVICISDIVKYVCYSITALHLHISCTFIETCYALA